MGKMPRKAKRSNSSIKAVRATAKGSQSNPTVLTDAVKAAEQTALAAFGSGLKVAAAFGSVAAKTTSLALASLAMGADHFSEMVKKEALRSSQRRSRTRVRSRTGSRHVGTRSSKREE